MSIIIIYLIGCFIAYMRANAFESYFQRFTGTKDYAEIVFVVLFSWVGFISLSVCYILDKGEGEKFFKI